jgi:hypothetical protein
MIQRSFFVGHFTILLAATTAVGADEKIVSPMPYQVLQREGFNPLLAPVNQPKETARGWADVPIVWSTGDKSAGEWEARVVPWEHAFGQGVDWTKLKVAADAGTQRSTLRVPAGGWYRLELRPIGAQQSLTIQPFGIGEVFLIAGQSYAGGHNDENLKVTEPERRVAAFNWREDKWQICDDPVPHVGPKGTLWPALGDLLVPLLQTPVGFVNASVGGTSTRQWAVDGPLFNDMVTAGKKTEKFRAVLWQQGESDVIDKTPTDVYVERVIAIRSAAMKQWGREVPWLPAKSTLHPTVYRVPEQEEAIRKGIHQLWSTPGFRPGPDTDVLDGENRGGPKTLRHFSGIGQRRAAQLWFVSLWTEIHRVDAAETR